MPNTTLSKSDFLLYLKHPAWLWLKKHEPKKLPPIDANLQALFDAGHEFEPYAETLFSGGLTLGWDPQNYGSYQSLPAKTLDAIKSATPIIYQGRLEANGLTAIFDILMRVDERTFDLYEIKSSTKVKPEHLPDLAFQTRLLEQAGFTVRQIGVIHVNSAYVRQGEIDPQALCQLSDVTTEVKVLHEVTLAQIEQAKSIVELSACPNLSPRFASAESFQDWMTIFRTLQPNLPAESIYNLNRLNPTQVGEIEDSGATLMSEIPPTLKLKKEQIRQIATVKLQRTVDQSGVKQFLANLRYPLYFLDYETLMKTIPPFDGASPYQQIPFQYSLHIINAPGDEPLHREFLHEQNSDPRPALVEQLRQDIKDEGSVIVWYQPFEKGRNAEMGQALPEHADLLSALNERVVDLMIPFSTGLVDDVAFSGSASIKSVLPVLVPSLTYSELNVQGGQTAQRLYMETVLEGKHPAERAQIMKDLLAYCRLDTLAMVEIYNYLVSVT